MGDGKLIPQTSLSAYLTKNRKFLIMSLVASSVLFGQNMAAHAQELVIDETVVWELVDSPFTSDGARIGDGENTSGSLTLSSGVEWTNDGGFYVFDDNVGDFVWTDGKVGLLIGSAFPDNPPPGDFLSTGTLILETGSIFNNTGDVVVGVAAPVLGPEQRKRGVITIHEGAVWNNTGLADEDLFPNGFRVANGELNVHGQLNSGIDLLFGGVSNAIATIKVDGPNAVMKTEIPDPEDPSYFEPGVIDVDGIFGATADLQVINGGTLIGGGLQVATSSSANSNAMPTGSVTIGNGGEHLSHADIESVWVGTGKDANGTLIINDQGRVDAAFGFRVGGGIDGQGLIEVNDGGLLVTPGANLNFPRRGQVLEGGTLDLSDGGKVLIGNGLTDPTSLAAGAVHLGFGGQLIADGLVIADVMMNNGSQLTGSGTITGSVTAGLGANINPGSSPGMLTITGNLNLEEGSVLTIEIGGTGSGQFDQINVLGNLILGGELNIVFIDDFVPQEDELIDLNIFLSEQPITGSFTTFSTAGLGEGQVLNISEEQLSTGQLSFSVIPEPASLALLTIGSLLLCQRRRR